MGALAGARFFDRFRFSIFDGFSQLYAELYYWTAKARCCVSFIQVPGGATPVDQRLTGKMPKMPRKVPSKICHVAGHRLLTCVMPWPRSAIMAQITNLVRKTCWYGARTQQNREKSRKNKLGRLLTNWCTYDSEFCAFERGRVDSSFRMYIYSARIFWWVLEIVHLQLYDRTRYSTCRYNLDLFGKLHVVVHTSTNLQYGRTWITSVPVVWLICKLFLTKLILLRPTNYKLHVVLLISTVQLY